MIKNKGMLIAYIKVSLLAGRKKVKALPVRNVMNT